MTQLTGTPTTAVEAVQLERDKIPPRKRTLQRWRTVWGLVIAFAGVLIGNDMLFKELGVNWAFGVFCVGMLCASLQYLLHPLRLLVALLRDVMRAKRGEDFGPNPNDTLS